MPLRDRLRQCLTEMKYKQTKQNAALKNVIEVYIYIYIYMKNAVFWDVELRRSCVNRRSSKTSVHIKSTRPHIP
jgi:hypothetical protein